MRKAAFFINYSETPCVGTEFSMNEPNTPARHAERVPFGELFCTLIQRLFTAWLISDYLFMLTNPGEFTNKTYLANVSVWAVLLVAGVLFILMTLLDRFLGKFPTDDILTGVSVFLYALLVVYRENSIALSVLATAVVCFVFFFLIGKQRKYASAFEQPAAEKPWDKPAAITAVAVLGVLFAVYVGGLTAMRYLTYVSPNFDFGIFANMFYRMKTTGLPDVTCERDTLLSHFAVHISPIYYLILPFYCLFPSPVTLQVAQAVILASGVVPVYLIARRLKLSRPGSVAFAAVYAFYPSISGGCFYDIHENCFLAPLLLWMFWFYLKKQYPPLYVFAVLTLLVKEDAFMYIAFFAVFLLLSGRDRNQLLHGFMLLAVSLLYFSFASYALEHWGRGIMSNRYSEYIPDDGGLFSVILTVLRNPALVLNNIADKGKLTFIMQTLTPLLFLPFVTRKPSRLILAGPYILLNLMPAYVYQHDIYFQYTFGSVAFLLFAAMLNTADFPEQVRRKTIPCAAAASVIMFTSTTFSNKSYYYANYLASREDAKKIEEVLAVIPADASVKSSTFLLAHVANRMEIYPLKTENDTEYAVIDLRYKKEASGDDYQMMKNAGWELVAEATGLCAVFRAPA